MSRLWLIAFASCLASPASACDTALLLAVDVSGSITREEYHVQMQGLAEALLAPEIGQALVTGAVTLSLMQWSGAGNQQMALPWTAITGPADVAAFAGKVAALPRPVKFSDTAIAEAIDFSTAQFAAVPACRRKVIDISGDGVANDVMALPAARARAMAKGIILNAIAIEATATSDRMTRYFRRFVITPQGFAITAHEVRDYPRAIRAKLLAELAGAVS